MVKSPEITGKALMLPEALEVAAREAGESFILRLLKGQKEVNPFAVLAEVQHAASINVSGHPRADAILGHVLELTTATFSLMLTTEPVVDLTEYHQALLAIERIAIASQDPAKLNESLFMAGLEAQIAWAKARLPFDPYATLDRIHRRIYSVKTGEQILSQAKPQSGFCANLVAELAREVPEALNFLAERPASGNASLPFAQYLAKLETALARFDALGMSGLRAAAALAEIKDQVESHAINWLQAQPGALGTKKPVEDLKRTVQLIQGAYEGLSAITKPFDYLVTWENITLVELPETYNASQIVKAIGDYFALKKKLGDAADPYLMNEKRFFEFLVRFAQCRTDEQPQVIELLKKYLEKMNESSKERLVTVLSRLAKSEEPSRAAKGTAWTDYLVYPDLLI